MPRVLLLALIALTLPASGTAAFPGTNGRLLFTQELQLLARSAPPSAYLCAAPADGARPMKVAEPPSQSQSIQFPAVDAAGGRVAYSRNGEIFISAPDGRGQRLLAVGTMPAWAPDGTRLFYANQGDLYSIRDDMSLMSAFTVSPRYDRMPAVSPDGRTVAFVRGPGELTSDELVLRDVLTGTEQVLVSTPGIAAPDWSPDGTRIAFAIGGTINTIASSGTDLRALASGTEAGEPAYSPDGTLIAFERDGDIWTMSTAGSALVNVTHSPVREQQPAWQTGTAFVAAGSDKPCAIVGTDQGEELVGTEYGDVFYDLGGSDTIRGLDGDDRVFDGEGIDRIEGGEGADEIYLRVGANTVLGGPGNDRISGSAGLASFEPIDIPQMISGEDGDDVVLGGTAADRIEGGPGNDVIDGLSGPDSIFGGPGNDRLIGNRGDDSLQGNQGDDVLLGGQIRGLPVNYDGYDVLDGGEGNDRLAGGWQKDRLFGGPGNDRLSGGPNADYLLGEAGIDLYLGEGGDDLLLARDRRRETVSGGPGFDRARLDASDRRLGVERAIR